MHAQPPGPAGDPVIGNARRYAADPFSFLQSCAEAYGDVVRLDLGPRRTYLLTNPEDIQHVLVSDARLYRKVDFGDRAIEDLLGDGLLMSDGETWQRQRRLANPAFHSTRVGGLADVMAAHARDSVSEWTDGDVIDIQLASARLTVRIIVSAMFGTDVDRDTIETIQNCLEPLGARFEPDPRRFFLPDWIPTQENRAFSRAVSTLEDVIDDLIERRQSTEYDPIVDPTTVDPGTLRGPSTDPDGPLPMDLLSILLRARDRGEQTDDDLRDELMTLLLAGHDTTALTLTYTTYLLSRYPLIRRRVSDEIESALEETGGGPDGTRPTAETVRSLPLTDRVIDESLRLYPPVYTLFRKPVIDVKLGGYRIPEDSVLMLPQWVVHRSDRWYDDPDTFDPDRWLPDRSRDRPRFAFFPFGGGPRHCIGKQFSLLETKIILATIYSRFDLEYDGPDLSLRGSLTMHPDHPVPMCVTARQ